MDKLKFDRGKDRLALVPPEAIKAIGAIMTHGLTKYGEDSWKNVEPWRYRDAMMRHLCEYLKDPTSLDTDSGFPHLWHLATNVAFLCELEYDDIQKANNPHYHKMIQDPSDRTSFGKVRPQKV